MRIVRPWRQASRRPCFFRREERASAKVLRDYVTRIGGRRPGARKLHVEQELLASFWNIGLGLACDKVLGFVGAHYTMHSSTSLPSPSWRSVGWREGRRLPVGASLSLSKTEGRGEHGWWRETTNEQVGWGGPTTARGRDPRRSWYATMWRIHFGAMGPPQRCAKE